MKKILYIGMDVHLLCIVIAVMDWKGKILSRSVIVCNPKHNRGRLPGSRNDRIDAAGLAELLRLNAVRAVYHGEHGTRTLKHLMRSYECLVSDITRVKNRLKSLFNSRALRSRGRALYHPSKRAGWIEELSDAGERQRAGLLFRQLEELKALKRAAQRAMVAESRRHPAHGVLSQVPELGPVRVAQIMATVDTPFRFRTKRTFWK